MSCHSPMAPCPHQCQPRACTWQLGTQELLQPVEPVLKAHSDAEAGNPVTSSSFGPREAAVHLEQALPGRTERLSPPWLH